MFGVSTYRTNRLIIHASFNPLAELEQTIIR